MPIQLMQDFRDAAQGRSDLDTEAILGCIIEDVQSSYRLAMVEAGIEPGTVKEIEDTVSDYIANHYGED